MNRRSFFILSAVVVCWVMLGSGIARAQEFSADMVNTVKGKTVTSKIYTSGDKVRMDMADNVMIIRKDKNLSWVVMPSEKMYMEHPLNLSAAPKVQKMLNGEVERVSMGNETINGYQAEKFKVTYKEKGKTVTAYQWIKDGKIPVKIAAEDGSWSMEYKNLVVGPQKADLFEPPANFEKMEMPDMGSMMKNMGGTENMMKGMDTKGMDMKGMDMEGMDTDTLKNKGMDGMFKSFKGMVGQ